MAVLRGIMRHLEHLPRYSATFTSIHIVSTLILDVRELSWILFLVFLEYLEILPHSPQCILCQHCNALILALREFFFLFLEHLEIPPTLRGAKDGILNTSQIAFFKKILLNFVSSVI